MEREVVVLEDGKQICEFESFVLVGFTSKESGQGELVQVIEATTNDMFNALTEIKCTLEEIIKKNLDAQLKAGLNSIYGKPKEENCCSECDVKDCPARDEEYVVK